jgi:hypothetical protein
MSKSTDTIPVRIDSRTTIFISPGEDPEKARERYYQKLNIKNNNMKPIANEALQSMVAALTELHNRTKEDFAQVSIGELFKRNQAQYDGVASMILVDSSYVIERKNGNKRDYKWVGDDIVSKAMAEEFIGQCRNYYSKEATEKRQETTEASTGTIPSKMNNAVLEKVVMVKAKKVKQMKAKKVKIVKEKHKSNAEPVDKATEAIAKALWTEERKFRIINSVSDEILLEELKRRGFHGSLRHTIEI